MPLNRRHVSGYLGPGTDPSHANFTWQDNTVSLHLSVVRAASEVASLLTPRRGRAPAGALPVLRRIWLADFRSLTWQPRLHCGLTGDSAGRISPGLRQGAPAARAPLADVKQSLGRDSKIKKTRIKKGQFGLLESLPGFEPAKTEVDTISSTHARPFSRTIPVRTPQSASRTDNFRTACHGGW